MPSPQAAVPTSAIRLRFDCGNSEPHRRARAEVPAEMAQAMGATRQTACIPPGSGRKRDRRLPGDTSLRSRGSRKNWTRTISFFSRKPSGASAHGVSVSRSTTFRQRALHAQGQTAQRFRSATRIEFQRSKLIFFRKTQSRLAYLLVSAILPTKAVMNALSNSIACMLTLCLQSRQRARLLADRALACARATAKLGAA